MAYGDFEGPLGENAHAGWQTPPRFLAPWALEHPNAHVFPGGFPGQAGMQHPISTAPPNPQPPRTHPLLQEILAKRAAQGRIRAHPTPWPARPPHPIPQGAAQPTPWPAIPPALLSWLQQRLPPQQPSLDPGWFHPAWMTPPPRF